MTLGIINMRLWSSFALERDLAANRISEWGKVRYLLLPVFLSVLGGGPLYVVMPRYGQRPSPMESMYSLVFGVLMAVVTYFGVRWAYRTNAKCDGKNFIERYTILNVPILVRFCVIAMPCSIIFITTIMAFSEEHSWLRIHAFLLFRIVALFVFYLYYYLLSKSFGRLGKLLKKGD